MAGFCLCAPRSRPVEPTAKQGFSAETIAQGEALAAAVHCASCHTSRCRQGLALVGGYGVNTPFGIIYGTNITPDPQTGIGLWSLGGFYPGHARGRVARRVSSFPGVPVLGVHQKLSDQHVQALYAYLMTRSALSSSAPVNTVPFPLKIRAFQEGWKLLFFKSGRFRKASVKKRAEWNRGACLAEGVADCSGCPHSAQYSGR